LNILLDGHERANAHVAEALHRLDDDLDVFALFVAGLENGQVADLRQQTPQFGLEYDQHGDRHEGGKGAEEPMEDGQVEELVTKAITRRMERKPIRIEKPRVPRTKLNT